jgi:hypothetical protein
MERPEFKFINPGDDLDTTEVGRRLSAIYNELYFAGKDLEAARLAEVNAYKAYLRARVPLLKDPDCPDPKQSGITATQQKNWINDQIPELWLAYTDTKTLRMNAVDYAKQLREQVGVLQSLNSIAKLRDGMGARF